MPRFAPNKMPAEVKRRYFELIRRGWSGASAAEQVGVSLSCGSLWFIDAGRVSFVETAISPRYLSQDDRIEIAEGLGRGEPVKQIPVRIGKCLIAAELNDRPRLCLSDQTPNQAMRRWARQQRPR
jgi:IS30 family transposase